ncbi:HlyD family secretion protein [Methyloligella sp. 2.7D]|uniref:HlyD family secretion protein n=1 Tax=unclassified Methyloligella TaxID=2625955 RepID=UPI00157C4778|nr:HlyD family secretion protein [Methyloligella sp. GL2]QKP76852.1 HlyD family secretion protein [Methyloligella sp. GL2]
MTKDASTESESEASSGTFSVRARWIALLVLIVVTIGGALGFWQYRIYYPSTENAYVGSEIVRVAPEVSGVVSAVYVDTDEVVKANDPLFDLDPSLYDAALRGAKAQFDATVEASGTAADDLKKAAEDMTAKRSALDEALAAYQKAKDAARDPASTSSGDLAGAEQAWDTALDDYKAAEKAFIAAQDANIEISTPTVKLRAAAAQLQKAVHDRVKTHILAPSGGTLSTVNIRPGSALQQGRPVFAIIEGDQWWVDANFKETDIARIHRGQSADIKLDMYPGVTFKGTVDSISPGSGATFSVLPPENASGNWVKVTQRFPVRVRIDDPQAEPGKPLRVGASATVTVDTTDGRDNGSATGDSGQAAQ